MKPFKRFVGIVAMLFCELVEIVFGLIVMAAGEIATIADSFGRRLYNWVESL